MENIKELKKELQKYKELFRYVDAERTKWLREYKALEKIVDQYAAGVKNPIDPILSKWPNCWRETNNTEFLDEHGTSCDETDEWYTKIIHRKWQKCKYAKRHRTKTHIFINPITEFNRGANETVPISEVVFINPYKVKNNGKNKKE